MSDYLPLYLPGKAVPVTASAASKRAATTT